MFNLGDKVLFKNEKDKGLIVKVNSSNKVTVKNSEGFEIIVSTNELIRIENGTNSACAYGTSFHVKDSVKKSHNYFDKIKNNSKDKIDLHIELLSPHFKYLNNYEIVQIQIDACQNKIEKTLKSSSHKLVVVHGIGSGLLKNEVHKLLKSYDLKFFLSKDGGSTEVIF